MFLNQEKSNQININNLIAEIKSAGKMEKKLLQVIRKIIALKDKWYIKNDLSE